MRIASLFMTVVGLGIAGGAVYYAQTSARNAAFEAADSSMVNVIAATQEIPFGAVIESHMLTTIRWPSESVPKGVFTSYDDVLPKKGQEPRRAERALTQGEILLASKVSEFGEKVTIVSTLGVNNRAMSIEVDAQSGVGGFVTPGDYVDIVLTQGRGSEMRAVTVLQNIRVVGVDQTADEQVDKAVVARTVTVEVSADQGQRLALAQQAGKLSLSLRSLDMNDDTPLKSVRLSDIILEESPVEESGQKPIVRVRRGALDVNEVPVR